MSYDCVEPVCLPESGPSELQANPELQCACMNEALKSVSAAVRALMAA
ncbi:MAG: hypothetical protein U0931_26130 [Vulcanimicrobiota bacterium]